MPGPHHIGERGPSQGLLHRVHHLCLRGSDIGSKVIDEVVHGKPGKTSLIVEGVLEWELRCNDSKPVGLEPLDNGAPAGTVGPGTMD